jgi:DNA-binding GntR family transcriptional regulator
LVGKRTAAADATTARFGAVWPVSRRQQVVDAVRDAIVSGQIVPGEQLKQDQLATELGVSPAPIREALRQLESEGLVTHHPNRGVFVTEVSAEELSAVLLPVRLAVEVYAFTQSASRLDETDIAELERLIEVMEQGAKDADIVAINEADLRFHELVVLASEAPHTIQLWQSVHSRIRAQLYRMAPRHAGLREIAHGHRDLLTVLRAGDPAAIRDTLHKHIVVASEVLLKPREYRAGD